MYKIWKSSCDGDDDDEDDDDDDSNWSLLWAGHFSLCFACINMCNSGQPYKVEAETLSET